MPRTAPFRGLHEEYLPPPLALHTKEHYRAARRHGKIIHELARSRCGAAGIAMGDTAGATRAVFWKTEEKERVMAENIEGTEIAAVNWDELERDWTEASDRAVVVCNSR